mmetsp:Transcript_9940/g.13510  ORF Transcript_9940/g.13510 Transcript_9940/m.13510 type:complete len:207 (+) Transcript_9940:1-621(+)
MIQNLQAENVSLAARATAAVGSEREALRIMQGAVTERDRTEEEVRVLGERLESSEEERERVASLLEHTESELKKATSQRDNHCAHAELILKEKNRYGAELAKLKREMEAAIEDTENIRIQAKPHAVKKFDNGKMCETKQPLSARRTATKNTSNIEAERDALKFQVRGLEQDREALINRFRAASESRNRLEKSLKKISHPPKDNCDA